MQQQRLLFRMQLFFLALFILLSAVLFSMQIVDYQEYALQAQQAMTRTVFREGTRGEILDRNGTVLATNIVTYKAAVDFDGKTSEELNGMLRNAFAILQMGEYECSFSLPLGMQDGKAVFKGQQQKMFCSTYHVPENSTAAECFLHLCQEYDIEPKDSDALALLSTEIGVENEEIISQTDAQVYSLTQIAERYEVQFLKDESGLRLLSLPAQQLQKDFLAECETVLGHSPYQDILPFIVDENQTLEWNTAEIRDLKERLGCKATDSAQTVLLALIERYHLENDTQNASFFEIAAVRVAIEAQTYLRYEPIAFASFSDDAMCAMMMENSELLPGLIVQEETQRVYPGQMLLSPILGYTGVVTAELQESARAMGYDIQINSIGRDGIEWMLNEELVPQNGSSTMLVDSSGSDVRIVEQDAPQQGNTVKLTIDADLQSVAEQALQETLDTLQTQGYSNATIGALVAMETKTGRILCMASLPQYDPNQFSAGISEEVWAELNPQDDDGQDVARPMVNQAVNVAYPPGSLYKLFVAAEALECGALQPEETITDLGKYTRYSTEQAPSCWLYRQTGQTHGTIDVVDALAGSCNYFFYELGTRLKSEGLAEMAKKFGFGESTKIGLPGEVSGIVGGEEYTQSVLKSKLNNALLTAGATETDAEQIANLLADTLPSQEEGIERMVQAGVQREQAEEIYYIARDECYRPSNVLSLAIGQGDNTATVLQMTNALAALSQRGERYRPTLVLQVDGQEIVPEVVQEPFLSQSTVDIILEGMQRTSQSGGTAAHTMDDCPVNVGVKTGSAEQTDKEAFAWFGALAPVEDPEIAVVALIVQGGSGYNAAAPVEKVLCAYFSQSTEATVD